VSGHRVVGSYPEIGLLRTGSQEATEGDFTPNKGLVGEIFTGLMVRLMTP
jgi:hypothetical protein